MLESPPRLRLVVERTRGREPLGVGIDGVVDEPTERRGRTQCLADSIVVAEIGCVGEEFDGEVELVAVDAAGAVVVAVVAALQPPTARARVSRDEAARMRAWRMGRSFAVGDATPTRVVECGGVEAPVTESGRVRHSMLLRPRAAGP